MTAPAVRLAGSIWQMFLFDMAEAVDLERAREIVGQMAPLGRALRSPAPDYVGFEDPPVTGMLPQGGIWKLFQYGVLCIESETPFSGAWDDLVRHSIRAQEAQADACREAEVHARSLAGQLLDALDRPHERWLHEDYVVVQLEAIAAAEGGEILGAEDVIAAFGGPIAQVVRGESIPLSSREQDEVLSGRLSCYGSDLLVAGWAAALIYEPRTPALVTMQLLEHANAQLLEFRHYEAVLDVVLKDLYRVMDKPSGLFGKWSMARRAERLNALRLDVMDLTERSEHSLRFLGDMFDARAYRMAAQRIGVDDYRTLVSRKLATAGELYHFVIEEFHQQRTFLLEALVVIILVIELWDVLFRHRG